ncbi:energy transducer TonB [Pontibacter sp. G13]|uniref:energy transducer TonB n=1 Tax=Pontibacter sp. G13 TaxID=3074898 RepID=UPI00288A769A|nr:energy transducer TonB [Pontibacter sp. G13]WNJ19605.1 energy transducer TonB [Pontibacter sp. G13]
MIRSALLTCLLSFLVASIPTADLFAQEEKPGINDFIFVDSEPVPTNLDQIRQQIGYPQAAVDSQIEGVVIARVLVNQKGMPADHKIVKRVHPSLAKAVSDQIPLLKFTPAMLGGNPVMYWINIPFSFKMMTDREDLIRKSIEELNAQLEKAPKDYKLWHKRGIQQSELRLWDEAIIDFTESISFNPKKNKKNKPDDYAYLFYAQFSRGKAYSQKDDYTKAIADFDAAIKTYEDMKATDTLAQSILSQVYVQRGYAHFLNGDNEAAKRDYNWVLEHEPDSKCDMYPLLADIGLVEKNSQELVKIYDGLIECHPEDRLLYYSRGYYKSDAGDYQGAMVDLKKVAEETRTTPLRIAAFNRLAFCAYQEEQYAQALDYIDDALAVNALTALSYYYRGRVFEKQGKKDEACEAVRQSLSFGLEGEDRKDAIEFMNVHCGGYEED